MQRLELEDYWMGYADELHVANYADALQHLWRLKMALEPARRRKPLQERA